MNPTADLLVALAAMGVGIGIGWRAGRGWPFLYAISLLACLAIALVTRWPQFVAVPWLGWIGEPRARSWVAAALVPALLLAPTGSLALLLRRRLACAAVILTLCVGLMPLVSAAWVSARLVASTTRFGPDGVCRQQTDYTCGPAAAVTALRVLGFAADEGHLALKAGTSPLTGTPPEAVLRMLREHADGGAMTLQVRRLRRASDLGGMKGPMLVLVRHGFMVDHWICVLGLTREGVVVADPSVGREIWPRLVFDARMKGVGVELGRP